ncbi:hypothetical protein [Streptosporangium sp. NPDC051022]|uniref:hypothetical protein n=1 Tax=Streptosporangium sp. NPDC051022 TaxID=3155752 RepID=UPI003443BFC1
MPDQFPESELLDRTREALAELLRHVRGETTCGDGCVYYGLFGSETDVPQCPAYHKAVGILAHPGRPIVLDAVTSPIPGIASVAVPGGDVGIDPYTLRIVHTTEDGHSEVLSPDDAYARGSVFVAAALAAKREPELEDVAALSSLIADFPDTNINEIARHILRSGYRLTPKQ